MYRMMILDNLDRITIILMSTFMTVYSISIFDEPYSISPDGQFSVLFQKYQNGIEVGYHPDGFSAWFHTRSDHRSVDKSWKSDSFPLDYLADDLDTLEHVVAIDADRFVFAGRTFDEECCIGTVQIIWNDTDRRIKLKSLHSAILRNNPIHILPLYYSMFNEMIYFLTSFHLVIYNSKTFQLRVVNWRRMNNIPIVANLLSALLINQTHLLITLDTPSDAAEYDSCSFCPSISLLRIATNVSTNNISVISHQTLSISIKEMGYDSILHMPISINIYGYLLIGLPSINRVFFAQLDFQSGRLKLYNRTLSVHDSSEFFGFSLCWLPDQNQFAINARLVPNLTLSNSLIYIYDFNDEELRIKSIFPNNQQMKPSTIISSPLNFHNLFLLHDQYFGILAKSSAAHQYTVILILPPMSRGNGVIDLDDTVFEPEFPYYFAYTRLCLPGTYKDQNLSIGPCLPCPAGMKAPQFGSYQCQACSNPSYCPLGSIDDTAIYPSISQTVTYPDSVESTSFDDIILSNMFNFDCLIISPTFWMLIVIGVVTFLLCTICLISLRSNMFSYRVNTIRILRQIDLVDRGQLWFGGLISCGIAVLIIFAAVFSMQYIRQYPIEHMRSSSIICHSHTQNAKFTSGLQLLALPKSDEERPIFELLDAQPFKLVINLINTLHECEHIDILQKITTHFSQSPFFDCSKDEQNITTTITIPLPSHKTTTSIVLHDYYLVGSVRVCLMGVNQTSLDGRYEVRELYACELFADANHSMNSEVEFDLLLTKAINRTEPLENGQSTIFSGLWIPTIIGRGATTKLIFRPGIDDYRRTFALSSTISIQPIESQFYILNKQEPIARKFEIVFQNILFLCAVLELLGLLFLISQLFLIPIIRLCSRRIRYFHSSISTENDQSETVPEINDDRELEIYRV